MGLTNYPFEFYIGGYPGPFFRLYSLNEKLVAEKHTAFPDPGDQQGYPLTHVVIDLAGNEKWAAMLRYLESRKWKGEIYKYADPGRDQLEPGDLLFYR